MSTFVISDIHGNRDFWKLLNKAQFSFLGDKLYIAGDIIDRGEDPLGVLTRLMKLEKEHPESIKMLLGNHELFLKLYLTGRLSRSLYAEFGGESTLRQLDDFFPDKESKEALAAYIDKMPLYAEVSSPIYGETVITHTGIDADHIVYHDNGDRVDVKASINSAFSSDPYQYMIGGDLQRGYLPASVLKKLDRLLIVGHVPTMFLGVRGDVLVSDRYIDIDTGSSYEGGKLSMLCIDDEKVFSV